MCIQLYSISAEFIEIWSWDLRTVVSYIGPTQIICYDDEQVWLTPFLKPLALKGKVERAG